MITEPEGSNLHHLRGQLRGELVWSIEREKYSSMTASQARSFAKARNAENRAARAAAAAASAKKSSWLAQLDKEIRAAGSAGRRTSANNAWAPVLARMVRR